MSTIDFTDTLDVEAPVTLAGDLHPDIGGDVLPIVLYGHVRVNLRPLIYEFKVLTKTRGMARLGDIMNPMQERIIDEVERQIYEYGQVRIIVLKARQMGTSTIIEAIIFALSILYQDFQSLIISHEADSAEHILGMTKRYWTTYPFRRFHEEQYNGRKQLAWSDLGSNIVVATARNVGAGRSKTLHALHASEVGMWDNGPELMTGLRQAIPPFGLTFIALESTAKGIGNYFHTQWMDAEAKRSEFVPLFFPWFVDPAYTAQNIPPQSQAQYAMFRDPDEEERKLIGMGVSIPKLLWRRWAIQNLCQGDLDKFKQEYPATPHEAFLSTGRNVFRLPDLLGHYQPMQPRTGALTRQGQRIVFHETPKGPLRVYRTPSPDTSWGIYLIGGDPTHTTVGDMACGQVINRRTMEQVAVLEAHYDPIEFGKQLFLLGEWYNQCFIAAEAEGPGYSTVGYLVGAGYPFVWESQKVTTTPGKISDSYGWRTNVATKHHAIQQIVHNLSQPLVRIGDVQYGLVIHDESTFNEMKGYVTDDRGGYMNGDGSAFDDCVMALGIAVAVHYIEPPPPAYVRNEAKVEALQVANQALARAGEANGLQLVRTQSPMQPPGADQRAQEPDIPAWQLEMEDDR